MLSSQLVAVPGKPPPPASSAACLSKIGVQESPVIIQDKSMAAMCELLEQGIRIFGVCDGFIVLLHLFISL